MVIKSATPSGHVISLTAAAWGHTKCAIALFAKVVRYRPVYATVFVAASQEEKAKKEIDAQFLPETEDDMRKLIMVVPLQTGSKQFDSTLLTENFIKEYRNLLEHGHIGSDGDAFGIESGPPQLVVLDFFLYDALRSIREVSGNSIPIYALQSASAAACLFMFGPESIGGLGDLDEKLKAIPYTDEEDIKQESERILRRLNGKLIELPGIPPMYDHEHAPQKSILPPGAAFIFAKAFKFFTESDGAILNTTHLFEGKAIEAFQEWYGERPVISVGPLDFSLFERQTTVSATGMEIEAFLDTAMEKYGPNSVIYFSFGSIFWPQEPEKYWAVLDEMIERGVPFIVAHASPLAVIPDEVKDKVRASGLGYMSNWLPQTTILSHKACGWFVTHCGHNSVTEAISAGVPMICWPFDADQPTNAANVTAVHNIGYELFEVRTGTGVRPIHRLGGQTPECSIESAKREFKEVLEKAGGEDGKIKRANMKELQAKVAKQWVHGGENWHEMKRISDLLQA